METYNKVIITVSLAAIAAIVGIESVLGAYIGQHLFEALDLVFGDDKVDSELEIKLAVALGFLVAFAILFFAAVFTMLNGIRGVKRDEKEEKLQKLQYRKWQGDVIHCLSAIADAINNYAKQRTSNSTPNYSGRPDDQSNHNDLVINIVGKVKEPNSSVADSESKIDECIESDSCGGCDSKNHQNNSESH